jgi:hypothetical protein
VAQRSGRTEIGNSDEKRVDKMDESGVNERQREAPAVVDALAPLVDDSSPVARFDTLVALASAAPGLFPPGATPGHPVGMRRARRYAACRAAQPPLRHSAQSDLAAMRSLRFLLGPGVFGTAVKHGQSTALRSILSDDQRFSQLPSAVDRNSHVQINQAG